MTKKSGWKNESERHSMARKGIRTTVNKPGEKYAGSGWGDLISDYEITDTSEFEVGDIILEHSNQFNARNVVKITRTEGQNKAYGVFINPKNHKKLRLPNDKEFVIWDFQFSFKNPKVQYFRPKDY